MSSPRTTLATASRRLRRSICNPNSTHLSFEYDYVAPPTAPSTAFKGHPNSKPPRRHRQLPRPRIRHSFTFQPPPKGQTGTRKRRVPALGLNRERRGRTTRFSSLEHRPADRKTIIYSACDIVTLSSQVCLCRPHTCAPAALTLTYANVIRSRRSKLLR